MFKLLSLFSTVMAIIAGTLTAEIIQVDVYWNPGLCTTTCAQLLAAKYQQVPGVAQITMNIQGGYAQLLWKQGFPLKYQDINTATRAVGLSWRNMNVKVRGMVNFQQNSFTLTSLGDNTVFTLLGPMVQKANQTNLNYNLASHPLSQDTIQKLSTGIQNNWIAIIDGELFMPWRYSNNYLIINTFQFIMTQPAVTSPVQANPSQPAYPSR